MAVCANVRVHLTPDSPIWRVYAYYYTLGGEPYQPNTDEIGILMRRFLIWLPFRWLFSAENRTPAVVWLGFALLAIFNASFGLYLVAVLLAGLLLNDIYDIVQYFRARNRSL